MKTSLTTEQIQHIMGNISIRIKELTWMFTSFITIGLAFIEGLALIVSPCILPILPIVLSGSLTGNKSRPLGIVAGFVVTFSIITLFSKELVDLLHIDPNNIRIFSFILLFALGIVMMSTWLTDKFGILTQKFGNIGSSSATLNQQQSGFWSGMLFGALIGFIWTPCAGPILAAVIVQVVLQQTTIGSLFTVAAFAIGAGIPMLLIALLGRKLIDKFKFIRSHATLWRKLLGVIIMLSVVFLYIETSSLTTQTTAAPSVSYENNLINGLHEPYQAPEISGITDWINSPPLSIQDLKGKVVLIDFWTYSCINCLRTLPYIKSWYAKYHHKGLVIIGIHSPEFQFEHDLANVKAAVDKLGVLYPVALDNHFSTWRAFNNLYWPAHYLIDKNGVVVYTHFGEGDYDVTENNIRYLLGLAPAASETSNTEPYSSNDTPETYLGYERMDRFKSSDPVKNDSAASYTYPSHLNRHEWALNGSWMINRQNIVSTAPNASINIHFYAKNVYVVMGNTSLPVSVRVIYNGKPVTEMKNTDINNGFLNINQHKLYTALALPTAEDGELELTASTSGLEIYTFTFGE